MSRTPAVPSAACPCGRLQGSGAKAKPLAYADCCGRFIDHWDAQPAPDAECLMRSRYTAFVRERADYLRATWHASTRPATLDFDAGARWPGLDVRGHRPTGPEHAEVEAVWTIYQRVITAYREPRKQLGKTALRAVINALAEATAKTVPELATLGTTFKRRAADILAFFDHPGSSNGPTEAINGRLEHLRGIALGFRNLTHYIA